MGGDSLSVPILYEANATDFNNLGLGPLVDTTVATVTEERNGQFILEMQYPVEGIRSSLITKNRILKVNAGHKLKDQRFVIKRINRIMGNDGLSYSIYAEHISYITADYALKPNLTVSGSGNVAMTQWLNGIIDSNRIHVDSDITTENTTSWTIDKVQNARQALGGVQGSILDVWGGEYRFDNLNISLLKHRGTVSNTLLSYGRNIIDFDQEENITNTYTSIYPFASYSVQNGDASEQKILTIPDLVVDSEYVNNFPNRKIQVVDFSDKFSTDEKPTVERLTELAKSYIKNNNVGVPTISTKISFVDLSKTENYKEFTPLEELDLCDEVPFAFEKFGIKTTAKISRIVWNVLLDSYDSLELGELKTNLSDVINNTNNAALDAKDAANDAKNSADNAALSANGKNRNWYGADDPAFGHLSELREGDSWYKPNGEDTELYHWINGQWVFILSTKDTHEAKDAADTAQKEAEEAKNQANTAVAAANNAVAKAGFANDTATQAKSDAASALQKALDAYNHGDQIKTGLTADIDAVKGQVSLKANQVDVDKLGGRVTDAEAQIELQADQIKLTVSKTELTNVLDDYATQTWTQGQIKTTADSINLSVSRVQSNLDNLQIGGRNYVQDSGFESGEVHGINTMGALPTYPTPFGNQMGVISYNGTETGIDNTSIMILKQPVTIEADKDYVMSYYYATAASADGMASDYAYSGDEPVYGVMMEHDYHNNTGGQQIWKRFVKVFRLSKTTTIDKLRFGFVTNYGGDGWKVVDNIQIEKANKVSDHSFAPEDYATDVQFASLELKVNGIQGTVADKADKSQVTQLANQITSVISSTANPNLVSNSGKPVDTSFWQSNNPSMFRVGKHDYYQGGREGLFSIWNQSKGEVIAISSWFKVKPNATYTISTTVFGSTNVSGVDVFLIARKADSSSETAYNVGADFKPNPASAERKTWTISIQDYDEACFRIDNNGVTDVGTSVVFFTEVKVEEGDRATPWKNDHTQTEIAQTLDMINLRVEKDKIVNQINISPESILISGQKVHITGQTTIDNAVIKDAMIANVKADKITAGTLNAANVDVINLNANNITTGTIRGANLSMNLNTGEVLFQKGAIRSTNGNLNIDIASGRMAVMDKNGDGFFFEDGMLLLSNSWDTGNAIKYGSITYGAGFPAHGRGITIKGVRGATLETEGHSDFGEVLTESGIDVYPNQIRMTSVGQVNIVGGNEYSVGYVKGRASINIGSSVSGDLGNRIVMNAAYIHLLATYRQTASGSANVIVSEDGALVRSTSASKYKTDIIRTNIPDYGEKLLELPTATWMDIAETKRYRDDPVNQIKPTRNFGMIAEDLADAGLEMLVVRGADGELEGINYDRIGPALIPVIAKLKNEVELLKQKLEEKTA